VTTVKAFLPFKNVETLEKGEKSLKTLCHALSHFVKLFHGLLKRLKASVFKGSKDSNA
jgi:hypothetical protein